MPSRFEPCGLSQMIALRYGTLPVVRRTGGLKDTVRPYDPETGGGNGFLFEKADAREFLDAVRQACWICRGNPAAWQKMVVEAMRGDYSWDNTAKMYMDLYRSLIS
jgi:starch synthase